VDEVALIRDTISHYAPVLIRTFVNPNSSRRRPEKIRWSRLKVASRARSLAGISIHFGGLGAVLCAGMGRWSIRPRKFGNRFGRPVAWPRLSPPAPTRRRVSLIRATSAADIPIAAPLATVISCHATASAFSSAICLHLIRRLNASVAVGGVLAPHTKICAAFQGDNSRRHF
jgi:hypothetical protein